MKLSSTQNCDISKIVKYFVYSVLALVGLILFYTVPAVVPDYNNVLFNQKENEFRDVFYTSFNYPQMQLGHSVIQNYQLTEEFAGIKLYIQDWAADCVNNSCEENLETFCLRLKGFMYYNPEELCGPLKGYTVLIDRNWNSIGMEVLEIHIGTPNNNFRSKWKIHVSQITHKSFERFPNIGGSNRKRRNVFVDMEEKRNGSLFLETRFIVNGWDTHISKVPWQASIRDISKLPVYSQRRNCSSSKGRHFCAGSIISAKIILSAAHCFSSWSEFRSLASLRVVVGDSFSCFTSDDDSKIEYHEIQTVYVHYGFDNGNFVNDLVIIKLKDPVQFSENIKAVKLSLEGNLTGKTVYMNGWGRTSYSSPSSFSNGLKHGKLVIEPDEICSEVIPKVSDGKTTSFYNNSTLCGRADFETSMAAKGDSGGGLIDEDFEDSSEEPRLIGVTSYIMAETNMSYFQAVSYFKDWIRLALYF